MAFPRLDGSGHSGFIDGLEKQAPGHHLREHHSGYGDEKTCSTPGESKPNQENELSQETKSIPPAQRSAEQAGRYRKAINPSGKNACIKCQGG